jgi:flagellar hook-length control protein FliK
MVQAVNTTDLADAIDATKKTWHRDRNNLGLSDKIQFSSILKTMVDTPEKMMDLAGAQTKAAQQNEDDNQPDVAERADFRDIVNQQRQAAGRDVQGADRRDDHQSQPTKQADKPAIGSEDTPSSDASEPKAKASKADDATPAAKAKDKVGKSFREDAAEIQQPIVQTIVHHDDKVAAAPVAQAPQPETNTDPSHGAQDVIVATLAQQQHAHTGKNTHAAASGTAQTAADNTHVGPQSTGESLKDEQASDMSNRLAGMGQFAINVDTGNAAAKAPQTPLHSMNANVNFGQFDGLNADDSSSSQNLFKGNSDGTGADPKATPSTHANMPVEVTAGDTSPQDLAAVFGQTMRTQAEMSGQGGAAGTDVKIMAQADSIQGIGAVAATGPTQAAQQTTKAAPAAPPQQAAKPQTPAEQIAVKIRQAVGDGDDTINIKLNPHELGRVEVRLELSKDGSITATVLADRKDTLDMLQKDSRGLERALNDAGLRTDSTSLSFGLRGEDQQQNANTGRDRKNGSNNRNAERGGIAPIEFGETAGLTRSNAQQRSLSADSGVDIKV